MMILEYICFGIAAIAGIVFFSATKKKNASAGNILIPLAVCILFFAIVMKLDSVRLGKNRENADVLTNSSYLSDIIDSLSVKRGKHPPYRLEYSKGHAEKKTESEAPTAAVAEIITEDDEEEEPFILFAQEPYAVIMLKENEENSKMEPYSMFLYSEGGQIDEEKLQACRTLVFAFRDTWATAKYTGTTSGTGTSERFMCYLYDVETGIVFTEDEIHAKGLPKSASNIPHYYISTGQVKDLIKSYME